jgi:uncharacterized protein YkwD
MQPSRLVPTLLVMSASLAGAAAGHAQPPADTAHASRATQAERALVAGINAVRARHRLAPLRRVAALTRPARAHSRDLVARRAFTHDSANGSPFSTRLVAAGFPRRRAMAENIAQVPARGTRAARVALRMWMASPPHRANILNRRMRVIGVGFAIRTGRSATVVTADFGG